MAPTLSVTSGDRTVPLLDESIGACLRRTAARHPDNLAVIFRLRNQRSTFKQLWDDVATAATALLALGIAKGDRVGVWSSNCYEWVVVQYATARIGAILVTINPAYQKDELAHALKQSGVRLLFHASHFKQNDLAPILDAARRASAQLERCIDFDSQWAQFLGDLTADHDALAKREASLSPDEPINIQFTSGTTGFPKGATLTHRNILNNAFHCGLALGFTPADRVCVPVPFYHCFGMVLGSLACSSTGACMVVPGETFQPQAVLEAVQAERCTALYGVPTMFRAILENADFEQFDLRSLRTGIMAGSPCPIELMKEVVERLHMREVAIGYGMTETSPLSTLTRRDDASERRVGSVGRAVPHVEISVRDLANRPVPRGEPGEFCARGYHVMRGYWDDEPATRRAICDQGWMHSGDLAVMDEDGYVRVAGRLKDVIIRGGENISPREVEAVLEAHPSVGEAQVVAVPSRRYGEEVMAWIKFRPKMSAVEEELNCFCAERLAAFKRPRYWRFVEGFPMTVTGKIQKYRLREMAIEALGLQAAAREETA
jgi:fatty-acyl-CoA synthase